eukprot:CAMPEP_0206220590 /NCGR_PEP_ID=MMETSP0047_2-20121206/4961_1 /ASSEMBLY_ACC=CAM_ASM_000192 /TAXON_ID=195065 /ORGANISM="Chroomonas mesostigmatica_cf, Strain CCMP1168" /LENGTH=52 /DNA_ID=CAMNT_0053643265 /DNA_START=156 /DNA_END=314 /DNA_ORIENTATION=-
MTRRLRLLYNGSVCLSHTIKLLSVALAAPQARAFPSPWGCGEGNGACRVTSG